MSPDMTSKIFHLIESNFDHQWHMSQFMAYSIHSVNNGSKCGSYLGAKIWELIPSEILVIESHAWFKGEIKKWKLNGCPCRLCRVFSSNLSFIYNQSIVVSSQQKYVQRLLGDAEEGCWMFFEIVSENTWITLSYVILIILLLASNWVDTVFFYCLLSLTLNIFFDSWVLGFFYF